MQLSNNNLHDLRQANSFLIATSGKTAGKIKRLFSTKAATFVMWNYPLQKFAKKNPRLGKCRKCHAEKAEQGRTSC